MELFLQLGFGMMDLCRSLISAWKGGTVILSPRDLKPEQLERLADELTALPGGRVLLDPQFYLPNTDHDRLTSHSYWPDSYSSANFWAGVELRRLLERIFELNAKLGSFAFILPGLYAAKVDDNWLFRQAAVADAARAQTNDVPLFATVALSAEAACNEEEIHAVLEAIDKWPVDGVYIVCEHPKGDYLVKDPLWIANVLDLVAGVRLRGKSAILGYCNHQMLIAGVGGATAVSSGTWMNVRSFPPDKFRESYDEEVKQNAVWYYCPQALSEYKLPMLDAAHRLGMLQLLAPVSGFDGGDVRALFAGDQPSAVGFSRPHSFRHYLECLRVQANGVRKSTFAKTVKEYLAQLDSAEHLLAQLHQNQIRGNHRDFREGVDVNRAALAILQNTRGPLLERAWADL